MCETEFESDAVPHVTIIRPVKGLEPCLYECLASTFSQSYLREKTTIFFCVPSQNDAAIPTLRRLVEDFPTFDVQITVQDEDANTARLGPNPKIRNMSKAYREAKGDIVWIIDCNVWVAQGVLGRMVDKLCGFDHEGHKTPYKFVHQLPLVVDITETRKSASRDRTLLRHHDQDIASSSTVSSQTISMASASSDGSIKHWLKLGGGRLEESFLASSHAKFYTAINTVLVAPCIVGKSNMFRRSHLDELTARQSEASGLSQATSGLDHFSQNICEDHLIGDLLWKQLLNSEVGDGAHTWGKHAMLFGDLAIQPMANMSVGEYCARRTRWLRVRKFTVTLATLVEPGTESFLCSAYASWAFTTLPFFRAGGLFGVGIPSTWFSFAVCWFLMVLSWLIVDWTLYSTLHSMASIEADESTPTFAQSDHRRHPWRSFKSWLPFWLAREALALPIWLWAVYGGTHVTWRGQRFGVGMDMRVHAMTEASSGYASHASVDEAANGVVTGTKSRSE